MAQPHKHVCFQASCAGVETTCASLPVMSSHAYTCFDCTRRKHTQQIPAHLGSFHHLMDLCFLSLYNRVTSTCIYRLCLHPYTRICTSARTCPSWNILSPFATSSFALSCRLSNSTLARTRLMLSSNIIFSGPASPHPHRPSCKHKWSCVHVSKHASMMIAMPWYLIVAVRALS